MTIAQKLHTLLAEALRCLDDGQISAVRRKIGYADVLVHEMTDERQADPARVQSDDPAQASGSATNPSSSSPRPQEAQAEPPQITAPQLAAYMSDNPPATIETDSPLWRDVIRLLTEQTERIKELEDTNERLKTAYANCRSFAEHEQVERILALEGALKAASQFIYPEVSRGPAVKGWELTVELVEAALAQGLGSERTTEKDEDDLTRSERLDEVRDSATRSEGKG